MSDQDRKDITYLLSRAAAGDEAAGERLARIVYGELRSLARRQRAARSGSPTLNTTALVHEAYLKLAGKEGDWQNRLHFFRVASRAMRDVLVDHARRKLAAKRGGGLPDRSLDELGELPDIKSEEVLWVHEALERLQQVDPRQGRVVELRYFVGLTIPEAAEVLGISPATVRRDWASARAWLQLEFEKRS